MKATHKIGAVFYALWGLLHIAGGGLMFLQESGANVLAMVGTGNPAAIPSDTSPLVDAVLTYHSFNLAWIGAFVLVVAVLLNWKNDRVGYWINLAVVSIVDLGLLFTTVLPGHMALGTAIPGIVLWIPALVFSSLAYMRAHRNQVLESRLNPAT